MQRYLVNFTTYLREVRFELKKVNWPTRQETLYYTLTVVVVCILAVIFLGGLDSLFAYLLNTFVLTK